MINYDKTIEKFFESVLVFLDRRMANARRMSEFNEFQKAIGIVHELAAGFIKGHALQDLSSHEIAVVLRVLGIKNLDVCREFCRVYLAIPRIHSANDVERISAQKDILMAVKNWDYLMSKNTLKKFYHLFLPQASFAVKHDNQR